MYCFACFFPCARYHLDDRAQYGVGLLGDDHNHGAERGPIGPHLGGGRDALRVRPRPLPRLVGRQFPPSRCHASLHDPRFPSEFFSMLPE